MNKNNYSRITYNQTTTYHTNGNYGLVASCSQNNKKPNLRIWFEELSGLIGKTISFSCDIKSLNEPLSMMVYQYNGTNYTSSKIDIPSNTENKFVVTTTVADTTIALWMGIEFQNVVNQGDSFYTDNWCLKEV